MSRWFLEYAEILLNQFGDIVDSWATFNEPVAVYERRAKWFLDPRLKEEKYARQCTHNLQVWHVETAKLLWRKQLKNTRNEIVVDVWHYKPTCPGRKDEEQMALYGNEIVGYGMLLHPPFLGGYSEIRMKYMEENHLMSETEASDLETMRQKIDFYGLNFYNGLIACADESKEEKSGEKQGSNY